MVNVIPRLDRGIHFGLGKLKMDHRYLIRFHFEHDGDPIILSVIPRFNRGIQHQRG